MVEIMMHKKSVIILIITILALLTISIDGCDNVAKPQFDLQGPVEESWYNIYQNSSTTDYTNQAKALVVDNAGNVYVTGRSRDDIATIKYNKQGKRIWVARYPIGSAYAIYAMSFDNLGNILVCGSNIIKYDTNGKEIWAVPYEDGSGNSGYAKKIVFDKSGNIIAVGNLYSGDMENCAVIKYDSNGNRIWVTQYYTQIPRSVDPLTIESGEWEAVTIDQVGNIYVAGTAGVIKYNDDGKELWIGKKGGQAIALDVSGDIYVTGYRGTTKYSDSGNILWSNKDPGSAVVLDNMGNLYVTYPRGALETDFNGKTIKYDVSGNELWSIDYGGSVIVLDNTGGIYVPVGDLYTLVKYDYDGNQQWEARLFQSGGGGNNISAISLDDNKNVYVTGDIISEIFLSPDDSGSAYCTVKYSQK